jgi:perosamine synthetase
MLKYQIPLYKPYINYLESRNVDRCLKTKWISSKGEFVKKFENKFKRLFNYKYAISVNNGTAALHLSVMGLDIKKGDEVIVPSLTYVATANAVSYAGAKVVFADINLNDWQISIDSIKKNITKKTKALILVHLYGQPCDLNPIIKLAKKNKIKIIEDCAEALGSKYNNNFVGSLGDISAFSFYGNKTITTGEGGMVVCKNKKIYKKILKLKSQGLNLESKKYYEHDVVGYNYRMTNICAAIGLAQLNKLNFIIKKKIDIFIQYKKPNKQHIITNKHRQRRSN